MEAYQFCGTFNWKHPILKSSIVQAISKDAIFDEYTKELLDFYVDKLNDQTATITEDDVQDIVRLCYKANPCFKGVIDLPNLTFAELGDNDKNDGVAGQCNADGSITINSKMFEKLFAETQSRFEIFYKLLETIGHEYTHSLQKQMVNVIHDYSKLNALHDAFKNGNNFQKVTEHNQKTASQLVKVFKRKVSNFDQLSTKLRHGDEELLDSIHSLCYLSYPHEQDARMGGKIFADMMYHKITGERKFSNFDIKDEMNGMNYQSNIQPMSEILNQFDMNELLTVTRALDDLLKHKKNGHIIYDKMVNNDEFSQYCKKVRTVYKLGEELFLLYCTYASQENLSELFYQLLAEGNTRAQIALDYMQEGWNANCEKAGINKKIILDIICGENATIDMFSCLNWTQILSEKELNEVLQTLISEDKIIYAKKLFEQGVKMDENIIATLEAKMTSLCKSGIELEKIYGREGAESIRREEARKFNDQIPKQLIDDAMSVLGQDIEC